MSWLRRLERRLRPFAIPNLTLILIVGMALVFLMSIANPELADQLSFRPQRVLQGEVWRLLTFLVMPGVAPLDANNAVNPVDVFFFVLFLMFLHLMGSALESTWGTLQYNLFLLVGYLGSVGFALLMSTVLGGDFPASSFYLYESIFLAFAYLFPEFEVMLFFFLPVKVKWLGLFAVVMMLFQFLWGLATFMQGGWMTCAMLFAATLNLSLFLGRDVAERLRRGNARMLKKFSEVSRKSVPRHTCCVCGATELTNPEREFRYCTECEGTPAYCDTHLVGHKHRQKAPTSA